MMYTTDTKTYPVILEKNHTLHADLWDLRLTNDEIANEIYRHTLATYKPTIILLDSTPEINDLIILEMETIYQYIETQISSAISSCVSNFNAIESPFIINIHIEEILSKQILEVYNDILYYIIDKFPIYSVDDSDSDIIKENEIIIEKMTILLSNIKYGLLFALSNIVYSPLLVLYTLINPLIFKDNIKSCIERNMNARISKMFQYKIVSI